MISQFALTFSFVVSAGWVSVSFPEPSHASVLFKPLKVKIFNERELFDLVR
jgi:hypothetical protein